MPTPAPNPVPEGMSTVTPHLWFNGNCGEAVAFYQRALDAHLLGDVVPGPDGGVWHAMFSIGGSNMMAADHEGDHEGGPTDRTTVGLFLYVEDCDAWFERAVDAGCEVIDPLEDMFWGDRVGKVKDPYGHVWAFATHKLLVSDEEMATFIGQGG